MTDFWSGIVIGFCIGACLGTGLAWLDAMRFVKKKLKELQKYQEEKLAQYNREFGAINAATTVRVARAERFHGSADPRRLN